MFRSTTLCQTLLLLTSLCISTPGFSAAIENLGISDAWIAEAPPVSKVMVAYLTLSNHSDHETKIVRATSENYSSIEFHETVYEDGLARMIRHEALTIPPMGTVKLQRGGKHLMLFNPVKRLRAGDEITIRLIDADGNVKSLDVPVKKQHF